MTSGTSGQAAHDAGPLSGNSLPYAIFDAQAAGHWTDLAVWPHWRRAAVRAPLSSALNPPELLTRLHFDRAVKTPYEPPACGHASELGARGHEAALAVFRRGGSRIRCTHGLPRCVSGNAKRKCRTTHRRPTTKMRPSALPALGTRATAGRIARFYRDAAQYRGTRRHHSNLCGAPGRFADLVRPSISAQLTLARAIWRSRLSGRALAGDRIWAMAMQGVV